ncbi:Uncharacterised protein [Mycobacteroides abscessus subsp. massiliense]|nr:Uncharacterised protein [Mycobacteroides abscessus subsp. massiliense]
MQVHQLHGGAVAELLGQRSGEALQRALGDALVGGGGLVRCGSDDQQAARLADIAQQRCEELVQGLELDGGGDAGGVEHQSAELVGPTAAEVVGHHLVVVGQGGAQRLGEAALATDQHGPGQRGLALLVAAQFLGLRDTKAAGEQVAGPGVDQQRVKVVSELGGHVPFP